MIEAQRLEVFRAQTENVRELERAWKHLNRQINSLILAKDEHGIAICTKLLALIYCALAEAIFSKLVHTPHGLPLGHISQIKKAISGGGIKTGWEKCAQLALIDIDSHNTSHVPNVKQKLYSLIDSYIFDPSILRNKLAHGQWVRALNRENTAENTDVSAEIQNLDVVDLYRKKRALDSLSKILEDIIESPQKAHFKFYWDHLVTFERELLSMSTWTMAKKTQALFAKNPKKSKSTAPDTVAVPAVA